MKSSRILWPILGAALATLLALQLDPWVFDRIANREIYDRDWGRMLRVVGSLVFWLPVALAVWLERRWREVPRAGQAWWLLGAPTIAGGVSELLKLLVRRGRPDLHEGEYVYRSFAERPLDSHDLGFPSSHVTVAFAGAAMLARFFPRAGRIAYALAFGCGVTRVVAQAHFVSDALAGGIAGWAVATWLGRGITPSSTRA